MPYRDCNVYPKRSHAILEVDEVDLAQVAELTLGYGGADIAYLCREAAFVALKRMINQSDNGNQDSLSVQETLKGNESNVIGFWINECGFESL